jgi:hypothetical protein
MPHVTGKTFIIAIEFRKVDQGKAFITVRVAYSLASPATAAFGNKKPRNHKM